MEIIESISKKTFLFKSFGKMRLSDGSWQLCFIYESKKGVLYSKPIYKISEFLKGETGERFSDDDLTDINLTNDHFSNSTTQYKTIRHLKTGNLYNVLGDGYMQTVSDTWVESYIYFSQFKGEMYTREKSKFSGFEMV